MVFLLMICVSMILSSCSSFLMFMLIVMLISVVFSMFDGVRNLSMVILKMVMFYSSVVCGDV